MRPSYLYLVAMYLCVFCLLQSVCALGFSSQSITKVEYVDDPPGPEILIGTVAYRPSDEEEPYYRKLEASEKVTGGRRSDYNIHHHDGKYVGWFGIVRNVEVDAVKKETRLLMEHKYFDGFTDSHLQAVSFNGSGDFEAILEGSEHFIQDLQLLKVYGKVTESGESGVISVKVDFARDWAWGRFTFIGAWGTQRGSDKWRERNLVSHDEIYSSEPNEKFYIDRLGLPKKYLYRSQFDRLARIAARRLGLDASLLRDPSGKLEKLISPDEFLKRSTLAALRLQPNSKPFIEKIQQAILNSNSNEIFDAVERSAEANMHDAAASVLAHALVVKMDDDCPVNDFLEELLFSLNKSVPAVIEALRCEDDSSRLQAANLLAKMEADSQLAIPALIQGMGDSNGHVRAAAAEALEGFHQHAGLVVPALILGLQDENSWVLFCTESAIVVFGEEASDAAPALASILLEGREDADDSARWMAASALGATRNAPVAIPALMRSLSDESPNVQRFAADGLGGYGDLAQDALPSLYNLLKNEDPGVQVAAAEALWRIEGNTVDSLPILEAILLQGHFPEAMWAANACRDMGPSASPIVNSLLKATQSRKREVCTSAIHALGAIGPDATDVLPILRELLKESDQSVRAAAATAIWHISSQPEAILSLIHDLDRGSPFDMRSTIYAIEKVGPLAKEAIPFLRKFISDQDPLTRRAAIDALSRIEAKAETLTRRSE